MSKVKVALAAAVSALSSSEARGPELAIARIVLGALAVKLGFDFSSFVR